MKDITKGSDEILLIGMPYEVGTFKFSESGLTNVSLTLYDSSDTEIGSYSISGSTIVPVTVAYNEDTGNPEYTADEDSDYCLVYLVGSTTTDNAVGRIKAKWTYVRTNTNFSDDTFDKIIISNTDYNLISNV
jgi:hypothetical protein